MLPSDETRVIYFKSEQLRTYWYNRLLLAQGFVSEIDQYEMSPEPIQKANLCSMIHATHRATGKDVAIKVVDKENTSEKMLEQFKGEAAILSRIRHNNVCKLVEVIENPNVLLIVMQYYPGGDLQNYMESRDYEPLSEETAKQFTRSLAKGIKYLHARGIIHRDIKPENILLCDVTAIESPVLADFGLAKHIPDKKTITGRVGTKGYMAPEILAGDAYSLPADIWSFGTLIYALVSS